MCKYNNIVITPQYTPYIHWENPSFYGCISQNIDYFGHYQYGVKTSRIYVKDFSGGYDIIDTPSIYCGYLLPSYGHFIIESLSCLYFFKQYKDLPLIFSYSYSEDLLQYQKDIFYEFGIKNEIVILKKPTLFKCIFIPPSGNALGTWFLEKQKESLEIIRSTPKKGKKIFIARSHFHKYRGARNEDKLISILEERNWKIIYPEELPFRKQIEEYATADIIFCISGSALHSLLFIKDIKQNFFIISRGHGEPYNIFYDSKNIDNYFILKTHLNILNPEKPSSFDRYFDLDIDFIYDILVKSEDFQNLSNINKYLQKPSFENINYSNVKNIENTAKYSDYVFYNILHNNKIRDTKKTKEYIYEFLSCNYLNEFNIKCIFEISKNNLDLNMLVLEFILEKFKNLSSYTFYKDEYIVAFRKKFSNLKDNVCREIGLYNLKKKNYLVSLLFFNFDIKETGNVLSRGSISEVYYSMGLYKLAIEYSLETVSIVPDKEWSYTHLAISYFYNNNIAEAMLNIKKPKKIKNNNWVDFWYKNIEKNFLKIY